jgi:hypothetical protein
MGVCDRVAWERISKRDGRCRDAEPAADVNLDFLEAGFTAESADVTSIRDREVAEAFGVLPGVTWRSVLGASIVYAAGVACTVRNHPAFDAGETR